MSDASEKAGWSFFGKLASFVVCGTLMTFFPEFEVEDLAAEALAHITEKGAELGMELGSEKVEEHTTKSSETDEKKEELDEQSDALVEQLETVIIEAFNRVFEGKEYETWIDNAPLSALGLFRIPPLAPDMSRADVKTLIAQAIAGFVHDDWFIWHDPNTVENQVEVGLGVELDSPGQVDVNGPRFYGAAAFGREFEGVAISSLPKVPLLVALSHKENFDERSSSGKVTIAIGSVNSSTAIRLGTTTARTGRGTTPRRARTSADWLGCSCRTHTSRTKASARTSPKSPGTTGATWSSGKAVCSSTWRSTSTRTRAPTGVRWCASSPAGSATRSRRRGRARSPHASSTTHSGPHSKRGPRRSSGSRSSRSRSRESGGSRSFVG